MSPKREFKIKSGQRKGIRLNISNEIKKGDDILAADRVDLQKLSLVIQKLQNYQSQLEDLDNGIANSCNDNDLSEELERTAVYNDHLLESVIRFSQVRDGVAGSKPPSEAGSQSRGRDRVQVKLPKIEINKFSGDPLKWEEFWDSFDSTIHTNDSLSEIDKFKYLKAFLSGKALRVVEGYRLTTANYSQVIQAMHKRFGNKQIAVFAHFEAMLAVPVSGYEVSELQGVNDECESHIRSLQALGLAEETFEQVFTPILLSKLPKFVRIEMHRKNGEEPWTLANARKFLREEILAREMSQASFNKGATGGGGDKRGSKSKGDGSSQGSASFLLNHGTKGPAAARECIFCGGAHFPDECTKFPDANSRRDKIRGRCFACFSPAHISKQCASKKVCYHCKKRGHHRSICLMKFGKSTPPGPAGQTNSGAAGTPKPASHPGSSGTVVGSRSTGGGFGSGLDPHAPAFNGSTPATQGMMTHASSAILQTALAPVVNPDNAKCSGRARLLLDTGCVKSFVRTDVAKHLRLKFTGEDTLAVAGFGAKKRDIIRYKVAELGVVRLDGKIEILRVNVIDNITCPIQKVPISTEDYPLLREIQLAEPLPGESTQVPIDVLIGSDHYYKFVGHDRRDLHGGLVLLSSSLGAILGGSLSQDPTVDETATTLLWTATSDGDLDTKLENLWRMDSIGIKDEQHETVDDQVMDSFKKTVSFADGRYSVRWPYKTENPRLNSNYYLAKGRFGGLIRRLNQVPTMLDQYAQVIAEQKRIGVVEEAPVQPTGELVYYIPHHCVIAPQRATTKIRVVYDASSKASSADFSLNDCLHRGPVILADVCGLLLRFRLQPVAVISDIEKAYLQVGLQPSDRDVTRFLWLKDVSKGFSEDNLVILRFTRVPFGVIASPFLLGATVVHHLSQYSDPIAKKILENTYVDNVICGCEDVEAARNFYSRSKEMFTDASMNLREWYSNSSEFKKSIPSKDLGKTPETKVLGLKWQTEDDTLHCQSAGEPRVLSLSEWLAQSKAGHDGTGPTVEAVTKRLILSEMSKVFDPFGFFSPVLINLKLLMQELWKIKLGWDEQVPAEIQSQWYKHRTDVAKIDSVAVPRMLVDSTGLKFSFSLHCFCDASEKAYATVIYLVWSDGIKTNSGLLFSRARVAPLKKLSIPRLELLAVVIGVRLMKFVVAEIALPILELNLWTDSTCVLQWIASEKQSSLFIRNKVKEIRENSSIKRFHVPSGQNPADLPSRGISVSDLRDCSIWWYGPEWIRESREAWPDQSKLLSGLEKMEKDDATVMVADVGSEQDRLFGIIDASRYSSIHRLTRVVAWILRAVEAFKSKGQLRPPTTLAPQELENAFHRLIKCTQQVEILTDTKKFQQISLQLGVYEDASGLLRCKGRLQNAAVVPDDSISPILLPKSNHVSRLIVEDCHRRVHHAGVISTLGMLRSQFWLVHGRAEVKKILRQCRVCRRSKGSSFATPSVPALPHFRVSETKPFSFSGLDYFGPLLINNGDGDSQKVWVCLFTCANIRAIHLEVVDSLSTSDFLLAFRRFCGNHGFPQMLICDNAPQFKAGKRVLDHVWKTWAESNQIQEFSSVNGIEWKFIPEFSPWMGGMYERMVGLVKSSLKTALLFKKVSLSELQTVMVEVTAAINQRPLAYLEDETEAQPLTPSHFFMKHQNVQIPYMRPDRDGNYSPQGDSLAQLKVRWTLVSGIANCAWDSWRSQYLLGLRERYWSNSSRNAVSALPTKGTVVQIKESVPRGQWKIGKIVDLNTSGDGQVRSAYVQLSSGRTVQRPMKLLCPLEIVEELNKEDQPQNPNSQEVRPTRQAAQKAKVRIREMADMD